SSLCSASARPRNTSAGDLSDPLTPRSFPFVLIEDRQHGVAPRRLFPVPTPLRPSGPAPYGARVTSVGEEARAETARLDAFSDGVFAIAITLLVLELDVPDVARARLWHGLVQEWPQFAAYLSSFFVIGIM